MVSQPAGVGGCGGLRGGRGGGGRGGGDTSSTAHQDLKPASLEMYAGVSFVDWNGRRVRCSARRNVEEGKNEEGIDG